METDPTRINQRLLNLPLIGIVALDEPDDGGVVMTLQTVLRQRISAAIERDAGQGSFG